MRLCLILKAETYFRQQYYKKNILALRGSFRPVTKVNMDMYEKSLKMFLEENKVEKENTLVVLKLHYQIYVPMVKLTNAISWTELNCFVHWDKR
jgi:hypothetical protein